MPHHLPATGGDSPSPGPRGGGAWRLLGDGAIFLALVATLVGVSAVDRRSRVELALTPPVHLPPSGPAPEKEPPPPPIEPPPILEPVPEPSPPPPPPPEALATSQGSSAAPDPIPRIAVRMAPSARFGSRR